MRDPIAPFGPLFDQCPGKKLMPLRPSTLAAALTSVEMYLAAATERPPAAGSAIDHEAQKRDILCNNAARLLCLGETEIARDLRDGTSADDMATR